MKTSSLLEKRDPVKVEILYRMAMQKRTHTELAQVLCISRQTMYRMLYNRHTDTWELGQIKKALWYLNVTYDEYYGGEDDPDEPYAVYDPD